MRMNDKIIIIAMPRIKSILLLACLLFYAIGKFLFVSAYLFYRSSLADTLFVVLHLGEDDVFYFTLLVLIMLGGVTLKRNCRYIVCRTGHRKCMWHRFYQ